MRSKDFVEGIPAICIESFEDILQYVDESIRTIFIDEVHLEFIFKIRNGAQTFNNGASAFFFSSSLSHNP